MDKSLMKVTQNGWKNILNYPHLEAYADEEGNLNTSGSRAVVRKDPKGLYYPGRWCANGAQTYWRAIDAQCACRICESGRS